MTPDRWREIERLYHAALERDAGDRAAFLERACAGDDALCREVESLLEHQAKAKDFIEDPAAGVYLPFLSGVLSSVRSVHDAAAPGQLVGRAFGVYQLQALIGSGGMGEVYRAVDTRLNRTVAIKVLPERVSRDPERRERFKREAEIVSSLNHPHICALYDLGVQDGIQYLVMEHIDGETLHDRLRQGPVPPDRALEYCIQICDALDKAHRRGVIHRDLKPANVMLIKSVVKLLDFGAATWGPPAGGGPSESSRAETVAALTATGVILGTLQYLSPEQLEGKPADRRSDIFMFGAVAYEMLTGKTAFGGGSQAGIIGAILRDDPPPIADLVPHVPLPLVRTISRCLSKDPDDRWQTASDLLFQLRSIAPAAETVVGAKLPARRLAPRVERVVWAAALLAAMVATYMWTQRQGMRPVERPPAAEAIRFTLVPPQGIALHSGYDLPFAVSPNGRQIVYVGDKPDGIKQLWLRPLTADTEQPIPGTDGANTPFWSPDGQWIGFFAGNDLKKVRVSSGIAQLVASNVITYGGAAWGAGDVIVFPATVGGLSQVSAQGGAVTPITTGGSHFWPQFLGDGEHFIYAAPASASVVIGSFRNEPPRTLMKFPVRISSLAYVPGYVFFVQDRALFARPLDETRLEFSGDAIQILDGIPVTGPGRAGFSVSAAGVLAYRPYPVGTPAVLRWFERDGASSLAVATAAQYVGFSLSRDAGQLLFSRVTKDGGADVWLRDLQSGGERQLTFDEASFTPHWSPDGTRFMFTGPGQSPPPKLFIRKVAGTGAVSRVGDSPTANFAASWSGDGGSIVSVRLNAATRHDLWIQRLQDNGAERLAFNTPFNESDGKVSPDGRWIAYVTDESGSDAVWVASFPSGPIRQQVSVSGGMSPQWRADSRELLYVSNDKRLVAVPFAGEQTRVVLGTPRPLFRVNHLAEVDRLVFPTANSYVATSDAKRFLVAERTNDPAMPPISVVVNWRGLLNR